MDEGGSLENCSPGNGTVGSNPTPSANIMACFSSQVVQNQNRCFFSSSERWLSGLKRWVANPLYFLMWYPGFESRPLRHLFISCLNIISGVTFRDKSILNGGCSVIHCSGMDVFSNFKSHFFRGIPEENPPSFPSERITR